MSGSKSQDAKLKEAMEKLVPFDPEKEDAGHIGLAAADRALDIYEMSRRKAAERRKTLKESCD